MRISRRVLNKLLVSSSIIALTSQNLQAGVIISRSDWGAKQPSLDMKVHQPLRITIHHTATAQNMARSVEKKMKSLQRFSQSEEKLADGRNKEAWGDIPYHFYIGNTGEVAEGRSLKFAGDTNTNYDPSGHIGIAVEGNFNLEKPNKEQFSSLVKLVLDLKQQFKIELSHIGTHVDFAQTACPGKHMIEMMPELLRRVSSS